MPTYFAFEWNETDECQGGSVEALDHPFDSLVDAKAVCCRDFARIVEFTTEGRLKTICEGEYDPDADEMVWYECL